jgi:hypothetical protein
MSILCDIVEEDFRLHSDLRVQVGDTAGESFDFDTTIGSTFAQVVAESFQLHSAAFASFLSAVASESFQLHSAIGCNAAGKNVGASTLGLHSDIGIVSIDKAQESFGLHGVAVVTPISDAVAESFLLHGVAVPAQVILSRAAESFLLHSSVSGQQQALLSETFALHGAAVDRQRARNTASEVFTLHSAASPAALLANLAAEVFALHSASSHVAHGMNLAQDTLYLLDAVLAAGAAGGAWAAPTDTFAMSRYTLPAPRAVGLVNGVILVACEDGIYALTGADDHGAPIAAHLESGLIDIGVPATRDQGARDTGDPHQKRSSDVYIAYHGGALRFGIGVTSSGIEERYWYDFPARTATDPTSNRAKIGRGARSRFWRFLLENVDGGDFDVKEQRVLMNPTKRRL